MYTLSVALPLNLPPGSPVPAAFPNLTAAVRGLAVEAQARWMDYANGKPLPDGRVIQGRSGAYARSIRMVQNNEFSYTIDATAPHASAIEEGSPARDMKRMLSSSLKARVAKDGSRYLIIPFRFGTPGTTTFSRVMPDHIHEVAKQLRPSRVTGIRRVPNAIGAHDRHTRDPVMVTRRNYAYGGKLPEGLAGKSKPHHKTDPFAGMHRFDNPGGGHSSFMTFRVMSEKSNGWIRPAVPGFWPARTVAQQLMSKIEPLLKEALARDVQALLTGS